MTSKVFPLNDKYVKDKQTGHIYTNKTQKLPAGLIVIVFSQAL